MQRGQVLLAQLGGAEAGVAAQVGTAHGGQVEGEGHAADQAHRAGEALAVRAGEERASVAPRIGRSSPSSVSDRSACTRSLTDSMTAAIATSMYWPWPVRSRSVRQARIAMAACR